MRLWSALAALGALVLSGCSQQLPTYRYRMTVEVETPEGLKTGSSVIEVKTWNNGKGFPGPEAGGIRTQVRGEAVAINIAPGQTLFALLGSPDNPDYAAGIAMAVLLPEKPFKGGSPEVWGQNLEALQNVKGARAVPADKWPFLVRFRDVKDPKSVEEVSPDALGGDVHIKRITIEVTDDDVTSGIEKRLPWIPSMRGKLLDGTNIIFPAGSLSNKIGTGDFSAGVKA